MSIKYMTRVWEDDRITMQCDILVLLAIADFADECGCAFPSSETLAAMSRQTERNLRKSLIRLKTIGCLDVDYNASRYRTNVYKILYPEIEGRNGVRGGGLKDPLSNRQPVPRDLRSVISVIDQGTGIVRTGTGEQPDLLGSGDPDQVPETSVPVQSNAPVTPCNGNGNGHKKLTPEEQIYEVYPRKTARPIALLAIKKALKTIPFEDLLKKTAAYAQARSGEDSGFTPHPATWFNQERFNDSPETWVRSGGPGNAKAKPNGRGWEPPNAQPITVRRLN